MKHTQSNINEPKQEIFEYAMMKNQLLACPTLEQLIYEMPDLTPERKAKLMAMAAKLSK
ncbi:MAG: hypothetical protein QM535_22485 [Limnohabitans sp.]|nr:hypothetical protein [Limnohabitans sp.]